MRLGVHLHYESVSVQTYTYCMHGWLPCDISFSQRGLREFPRASGMFASAEKEVMKHYALIERFGRYPHRYGLGSVLFMTMSRSFSFRIRTQPQRGFSFSFSRVEECAESRVRRSLFMFQSLELRSVPKVVCTVLIATHMPTVACASRNGISLYIKLQLRSRRNATLGRVSTAEEVEFLAASPESFGQTGAKKLS